MNHNESYYLMFPDYKNSKDFNVVPTEETGLTRFHYKKLTHGIDQLSFISKTKASDIVQETEVLFCEPTLLVSKSIKEVLENKIYGGQFYPALVETGDNNYHEFFVVNLFEKLDCWDRNKSVFELDEDDGARVYKYSLDSNVLDEIEVNDRQIFKIGGTDLSPVFVHEKAKEQLSSMTNNLRFFPVLEYNFGDEYN